MSTLNILLASNPSFKFVAVEFANSQTPYTYKTTLDLEDGDTVVVDTPRTGMTCAVVTKVLKLEEVDATKFDYKWVVSKVDTDYYEKVLDMQAQVQKTINDSKRSKLVKEMKAQLAEEIGDDAVAKVEKLVRL